MKRYSINATHTFVIEAEDEVDAWEKLCECLEHEDILEYRELCSSTGEIPYTALPSSGAERWATAATACRFAEATKRDISKAYLYDGSWWWTNGHVMLRCEGDIPVSLVLIRDDGKQDPVGASTRRKETKWSPLLGDRNQKWMRARQALSSPDIFVAESYWKLINDSVPGVKWMVGNAVNDSVHALDQHGKLVAVVMGMRMGKRETLVEVSP